MFLYSKWLSLDLPTRMKVAGIFDIEKKGSTHVVDNRIQSDGYNIEEVEAKFSVENIQKYLGVKESNPDVLWDLFFARMEGKEVEVSTPDPSEEVKKAPVSLGVLPKEEAKKFKKEYKARVKKVAPKAPVKKNVKRATKKK